MVAERQQRYPKGTYKVLISPRPDGLIEYQLTNLATKENIRCLSVWRMLKALDTNLTENHYPQKTFQYRTWGAKAKMTDVKDDEVKEFAAPGTNSPTFVIKVLFRQNATWQGSIQWLEGKQTRQFRSEFEMLKLMDEAMQLTENNAQQETTSWNTKQ